MQGLSSFNGVNSALHRISADSTAGFELTGLNVTTPVTGLFGLDTLVASMLSFESVLYLAPHGALFGLTGAALSQISLYLSSPLMAGASSATLCTHVLLEVEALTSAFNHVSAQPGSNHESFHVSLQGFSWLFESADVFLLGFEVICATLLFSQLATLKGRLQKQMPGYDDVVTFCQVRGVSITEVFGLVTFALGFILFDMFVSLAEDDSLEALSYVFASVIVCAVVLLFLAADVQFYFLISSISGGELTLRILYTDVVNNGLCLLRVFFCWIRYIFYDLQAELVDLAFHYTELGDESALEAFPSLGAAEGSYLWALLANLSGMLLVIFLDLVSILFQILIGAFKLALALFLFWLILDLFLLRTVAHTEAASYLVSLRRQSVATGRSSTK